MQVKALLQWLVKWLLTPLAFAVGLLWPLTAQVLLLAEAFQPGWQLWLVSALLVLPFALMAQLRGSWIWIK